jgi:transposase
LRRPWPFSRSIIITCIHAGFYASFNSASWHTQGVTANVLPDLDQLDKGALKALAIQLAGELRQQRETLAQQEVELAALEAEFATQRQQLAEQGDELRTRSDQIEHLKLLVEKLRRTIFGKKSEKIVVQLEQFELELEELETTQAAAETIADGVRPEAAPQARPKRKPLPAHLPRQAVTHTPEHTCCPDYGGSLKQFGEDVSEQLEYVPESFKVIRHVRPKFACTACERVVEAPAPSRPIERGLAGPALLAHVLVSKFCDYVGLPVMLCRGEARA